MLIINESELVGMTDAELAAYLRDACQKSEGATLHGLVDEIRKAAVQSAKDWKVEDLVIQYIERERKAQNKPKE